MIDTNEQRKNSFFCCMDLNFERFSLTFFFSSVFAFYKIVLFICLILIRKNEPNQMCLRNCCVLQNAMLIIVTDVHFAIQQNSSKKKKKKKETIDINLQSVHVFNKKNTPLVLESSTCLIAEKRYILWNFKKFRSIRLSIAYTMRHITTSHRFFLFIHSFLFRVSVFFVMGCISCKTCYYMIIWEIEFQSKWPWNGRQNGKKGKINMR